MKNMFEHITDVVELHLSKFKEKSEILKYFGLGNQGFSEILDDLKRYQWFKHKRKQAIEEIIQNTIANYLHKSN